MIIHKAYTKTNVIRLLRYFVAVRVLQMANFGVFKTASVEISKHGVAKVGLHNIYLLGLLQSKLGWLAP